MEGDIYREKLSVDVHPIHGRAREVTDALTTLVLAYCQRWCMMIPTEFNSPYQFGYLSVFKAIYGCDVSSTLKNIVLEVVAFSSLARILGECLTIHTPSVLFFVVVFFTVEISSCTLIPLFRPGSVHSDLKT